MVLPISAPASRMAVELIKRYALSHGLSPPDALIAAIALNVKGTLISGNHRDFACVWGLKVQAPPYRGAGVPPRAHRRVPSSSAKSSRWTTSSRYL